MEVGPKLKLADLKKQSAVKLRDGRRHHAALAAVTLDAPTKAVRPAAESNAEARTASL